MFSRFITWDDRSLARWEEARARGRSRFVWINGVLMFGGFMFLIMFLMKLLFDGTFFPEDGLEPAVAIPVNLVVWALAGYAWGAWMWWIMDRSYTRSQRNNERISA